jgi:hypothetical protein
MYMDFQRVIRDRDFSLPGCTHERGPTLSQVLDEPQRIINSRVCVAGRDGVADAEELKGTLRVGAAGLRQAI